MAEKFPDPDKDLDLLVLEYIFTFTDLANGGGKGVRMQIDGVKVFSATKFKERQELGDRLTAWMAEHPDLEIIETKVTQSSDSEFHCLTITVFYRTNGAGHR